MQKIQIELGTFFKHEPEKKINESLGRNTRCGGKNQIRFV